MTRVLTTPGGRPLAIAGDVGLVTLDRLDAIGRRLDAEPRLVSVSLVGRPLVRSAWLRATAPAGGAVVMATDAERIVGPMVDEASAEEVRAWATAASDRGLWHDWYLGNDVDLVRAPSFLEPGPMDASEEASPSSSRFAVADACGRQRTLTVTIDAAWLGEHQTGAQVLTVAAVEALARQPQVAGITLTGLDDLPAYAARLGNIGKVAIARAPERADIAWYPNQADGRGNLEVARDLGRRVVVTYLDLIAYDIPRYHATRRSWEAYRSLQRSVALLADGVTTISADVAGRLLEEVPRLPPERIRPVPLGLDHVRPEDVPESRPAGLEGIGGQDGRPFLLVLGNDFAHKNRDLAIAAWQELLRRGIEVDLVLAGLHVRGSSSREAEDALLASHVDLHGSVHRLGHVPGESRAWLLANAAVVHYPTSAEGFGFVPYEAACLGTASTFTDFGPLREITGARGLPSTWELSQHADDLERLLTDPGFAASRIADLRAAIERRTWGQFAAELVAFFAEISAMEPSPSSAVTATTGDSLQLAQVLQSRSYRLAARLQGLRLRRGR